ncbi:MAG: NADH-quinone oxidoreductase subunit C [Desulfobacula sp.]|nr:NADH-quinone oxidoreductase subunit C [Desulfobacula sp.]
MLKEMVPVSVDNLVKETAGLKIAGYRFVTLSCAAIDKDHFDILYHFDLGLDLKHLRLTVSGDTKIPSISPVYFAAFLVENEIQDLFGIFFEGLVIDYRGTLFLEKMIHTPFCKYTVQASQSKTNGSQPLSGSPDLKEES